VNQNKGDLVMKMRKIVAAIASAALALL